MKRTLCAILTAVFLSALCIPCTAVDTGRTYPGFSDVTEGTASYEAIKLCYEQGLINGISETAFNPQGRLNIAQLVVLAARLYDLQNGGSGEVPELPDLSQPFIRYRDADGTVFYSSTIEEAIPYIDETGYVAFTPEENADIPETCTLEVGYEGYNHIRTYQGTRETYHSEPGYMTQGFYGTGYRITRQEGDRDVFAFLSLEWIPQLRDAWWFPAVFYLGSEGVMGFDGDLLYRANGRNQSNGYDPMSRFSSDNANRALFAWLVDLAAGELPVINESLRAPDVDPYETPDAGAILRLYRAGILTGVDQAGSFGGERELTRAQAAIMLARVLEPSLRVKSA